MKFCSKCGELYDGLDGDNVCISCKRIRTREQRNRATANRRARESVLRDLGLVKVRGALGGVYYE